MEFLRHICALLFYGLLFSWIIVKIINISLVRKLNCKDEYKEINRNNKKDKKIKILWIVSLILLITTCSYILVALVLGVFSLLLLFFTVGGYAFSESSIGLKIYNIFTQFISFYYSLFKYLPYIIYILLFIVIIRLVYINVLNYKQIKKFECSKNDSINIKL